jgi:hypothetical protein
MRMKVNLRKLRDCDDPYKANHIPAGTIREGYIDEIPTVGNRFELVTGVLRGFSTSTVQEILSPTTFRTYNSIYEWHLLEISEFNEALNKTLVFDVKMLPEWATLEQVAEILKNVKFI